MNVVYVYIISVDKATFIIIGVSSSPSACTQNDIHANNDNTASAINCRANKPPVVLLPLLSLLLLLVVVEA